MAEVHQSVIDFHVHAFPDRIAGHAIRTLEKQARTVRAWNDGTVGGLLQSMDRAGIARAVVCSIATKPSQFEPIFQWSREIRSDRLIPLPSVHPADPALFDRLRGVAEAGFPGIKIHPYYQDFYLDAPRVIDLLRCARDLGLMVVCHTGFDIAFPRERRADPARVLKVLEAVDGLCLVATHLGGWDDWDAVERWIGTAPLYREISFAFGFLEDDRIREMIENAPPGKVLFGTDSPWNDPARDLARVRSLGLSETVLRQLLVENAEHLLARLRPASGSGA